MGPGLESEKKTSAEGISQEEVRQQALKEIKEEVEKAKKEGKEEELGEKLRKELQNKKILASEAVSEEVAIRSGRQLIERELSNKLDILKSFTRIIEAVKLGISPFHISQTKEGADLLQKIAQSEQKFSASSSAVLVHYFGDYLLGEKSLFDHQGKISSSVQNAFKQLAQINPSLAEYLREIFISLAREGKLKNTTEKEAEEIFRIEKRERARGFGGRDKKRLEELRERLIKALNDYSNLPSRNADEEYALSQFVYGGFEGENEEERELLDKALKKVGISPEEKKEFIELLNQYQSLSLDFVKQYMGVYARDIEEAEEVFRIDNLLRLFPKTKDGKIDFKSQEARRRIKDLIDEFHFRVLEHIHSDYGATFEEAMHDTAFGYYFSTLRQIISVGCNGLIEQLRNVDDPQVADFIKFLNDIRGPYLARIMANARFLHNLPLWARSLGNYEKLGEFLANLFPSQLAELFDDDGLMQLAREVSVTLIGESLAKNKNKYVSSLFGGEYSTQGVRWSLEFRERMTERLRQIAKGLYDLGGKDEWKLTRAVTYAPAIGIIKLTDILKAGTADPDWGNFAGIHPWMAAIQAVHNWNLGRGGRYAGRIARFLLGMPLEIFPIRRPFLARVWSKKRWRPEEFKNAIDEASEILGARLWELMLTKATPEQRKRLYPLISVFQELLRILSIPADLDSRAGWRIGQLTENDFKKSLKEKLKKMGFSSEQVDKKAGYGSFWKSDWSLEDWRFIMDTAMENYGTGSLFWYLTTGPGRLSQELKRLVWDQAGREERGERAVEVDFESFFEGIWEPKTKTLEKMFDFEIGGRKEKRSLAEIREIRRSQLMGEIFFRHLRRNPGDFLILLTQMVPDLLASPPEVRGGKKIPTTILDLAGKTPAEIRREIRSLEGKSNREKQQWLYIFESYYDRWGENFFILKEVRKWLLTQQQIFNEGREPDKKLSLGDLFSKFVEESLKAKARAVKRHPQGKFLYLEKEDFVGEEPQKVFEAFFGKNGLTFILTKHSFDNLDNFFQAFGDYNKFGEDNFFYRLAWVWRLREGDINPFVADINHLKEFQYLGKVGEDVFGRLHGDAAYVYQEAIKNLAGLPELLFNIANHQADPKELDKVFLSIFNALKGTMGDGYAWRAVAKLAQLTTMFFLEEDWTRGLKSSLFFPFTLLKRAVEGKKISLSKIVTNNIFAYSMDTDAVRRFFLHLSRDLGVLPEKGMYSEDYLNQVFEATLPEFLPEFGFRGLWFLAVFLFLLYLKKALEEQKKK